MRPTTIRSAYRDGDMAEKLVAWAFGLGVAVWLAFTVVGAFTTASERMAGALIVASAR